MTLTYLDKIIESGQVRLPYDVDHSQITLEEKNPESKIGLIEINGFKGNCFAFRLDGLKKNIKTHLYLKDAPDIHKGCDAIIIFEYDSEGYILICELKSNSTSKARRQIESSNAFIDYLCSLTKRFNDTELYKFKRFCYIFTTRALANKKPLQRKPICQIGSGICEEKLFQVFCEKNKPSRYSILELIGRI